ncbi:hypothetical protein Hdeb2414_s0017g00510651 [Helianthus debilis subsp. tardiflorus]
MFQSVWIWKVEVQDQASYVFLKPSREMFQIVWIWKLSRCKMRLPMCEGFLKLLFFYMLTF